MVAVMMGEAVGVPAEGVHRCGFKGTLYGLDLYLK
jgi:hypothetical protein